MEKTNEKQFRNDGFEAFVNRKQADLNELVGMATATADKANFLKEFFLSRKAGDEFVIDGSVSRGIGHILNEMEADMRLIDAEILNDVDKKVEAHQAAMRKGGGES